MPSPAGRPLLSLTLTLTLLAMFTLLLTAVAIDRAEPAELAIVFPHQPNPAGPTRGAVTP